MDLLDTTYLKKLLEEKHEVTSYDANRSWVPPEKSLYPGYFQLRMDNLGGKVRTIIGDTTDRNKFLETLSDVKPNYVIHLAALPLADVSNKYGSEAKTTIQNGTETVLDCIREYMQTHSNFKRFTFASSSMVYGDFNKFSDGSPIPAKETDNLDPKKSMYATYKANGETITKGFGYVHRVPITIIRPSAVYGPTDSNRRVTEILVNNALTGKPLILQQGGTPILDFTYVKDTSTGFILATTDPKGSGETFNITAGQGRSLEELAQVISEIIPGIEIVVEKTVDRFRPSRGALDITKARTMLGYNPKYTLEKGMEEYIDFVTKAGILKR